MEHEGAVFMNMPMAILFDFVDSDNADQAFSLLQELGYDPAMHNPTRLHIHVIGEDLTSALEICQAHGGTLVEQSTIQEELIASTTYCIDAIMIADHIVNEDLVDHEELLPDIGDMSSFSGGRE